MNDSTAFWCIFTSMILILDPLNVLAYTDMDQPLNLDHNENGRSSSELSPLRLIIAVSCPMAAVLLSYKLQLGIEWKLAIGILRTIVQLLLLGYVLLNLIFHVSSPLWVMGYILMMLFVAAVEVVNRQKRTYPGHFFDALCACCVGGLGFGLLGAVVIIPRDNSVWWDPVILVPTVGIIIGNSVPGPSVAVDRLTSDAVEKAHEIEIRLCFGATAYEASLHTVQAAVLAALIPKLNFMSVVGLVTIPGMMTGQLMGGASPIVAAQYQMIIIFLAVASTTCSTFIAVMCALRHAIMECSSASRLTLEKVVKKDSGADKLSLDCAIIQGLYDLAMICKILCIHFWHLVIWPLKLCSGLTTAFKHQRKYTAVPRNEREADGMGHDIPTTGSLHENNLVVHNGFVANITHCSNVLRIKSMPLGNDDAYVGEAILSVSRLNLCFERKQLLPDGGLNFVVHKGEVIAIEGPSGIGKSRLLRSISLLDCPQMDTEMHLPGTKQSLSNACWRSKVMYIPQALPPLNGSPIEFILECSMFAAQNLLSGSLSEKDYIESLMRDAETALQLQVGSMDKSWSTLSGGERQRALIACGIIIVKGMRRVTETYNPRTIDDAKVLLLDEPTAACDLSATLAVEKALLNSGAAIVIVTHDERQAARLAHRRILLQLAEVS